MLSLKQNEEVSGRAEATHRRLLHATEHLFAARGFAGVTMREVAQTARANVAAAHYHFGSKEGLVMEMLRRRIAPINAERFRMLDEAKNQALGEPLKPTTIFEALLLPIVQAATRGDGPDSKFMQLVGRSFTEPAHFLEKVHRRLFRELAAVFMSELRKSHPDAEEEDLFWNLHFVVATMLGALAQHWRVAPFSGGICDDKDVEGMIRRLVRFAAGGFSAGIKRVETKA